MRQLRLLFLLALTFVAQSAWAASNPALQSLEQQLQSYVTSRPGDYGIAALDLRTGELVGVRMDEPFPMASTVKIAIAANYLAQIEHGRRSLDTLIAGKPASTHLEAMMIRSDNYATDLLLRDLGGPRTIQAWLAQRGVEGVRVDRSIAQLLSDRRDLYDRRDSSTPAAMVNLLRRLDDGELLQPSSRQYLLALMARCATGKNRIRGLLPSNTPVEHKTGTLSGLTADVGFITLPGGRRVAVAFFGRNGAERPQTIATAARAIYEGFSSWLTGQPSPILAQ